MDREFQFIDRHIQTFWAVAEKGSFLAVSKDLYISQPALTKQINLLEKRLGFRLFERSNKGVKLTKAGERYYHGTKRIFEEYEKILDSCYRLVAQEKQTLRIGYYSSTYNCYSLIVADQFHKLYPEVELEMVEIAPDRCAYELLNDHIDVCTGYDSSRFDGTDIVFSRLKEWNYYCVMSADHPLAQKASLTAEDLVGQSMTLPPYGVFRGIDALHDFLLSKDVNSNIQVEIYNNSTYRRNTLRGNMIVTFGMERQYDLNKVIPLEWKPLAAHGVIHMANPKDSIKKFVELARKICEKG